MNKHNYILVMGAIAIILFIITNFIRENYIDSISAWDLGINVIYILLTSGIGFLLYNKVKK